MHASASVHHTPPWQPRRPLGRVLSRSTLGGDGAHGRFWPPPSRWAVHEALAQRRHYRNRQSGPARAHSAAGGRRQFLPTRPSPPLAARGSGGRLSCNRKIAIQRGVEPFNTRGGIDRLAAPWALSQRLPGQRISDHSVRSCSMRAADSPQLTSSRHQLRSPRSPCPRHLGPRLCASDEWPRRLFDGVLNCSTPTKEPGDQAARRGLQRTICRAIDRRSLRQRLLAVDRPSAPIRGSQGAERGRRSPLPLASLATIMRLRRAPSMAFR